jgi:gliding motility-associated-like protein
MNVGTNPDYNCVTSAVELTVTISGLAVPPPPYTLTSSPAGVYTVINVSTVALTNVPFTGAYTVYVAASGTCSGYGAGYYVIPTSSSSIVFSNTMVSCYGGNDGATAAIFSGGTAPFTWSWSTGSSNPGISGLSAGVYTVSITDNKSCTATRPVTITESPEINSQLSSTLITCFGSSITSAITTTGGVSPYSYTVNGNPVTGSPAGVATNLLAGVQTILTKDTKGCLKTNTVALSQLGQQIIVPTITQPSCPGKSNGSVSVTVSGPVSGYTYTWQPGNSTSSVLSNVPSGNYTLSVKDANSCITKSVIAVTPASSIVAPLPTIQKENCSAADGAFTLSISGGNPPYTQVTLPVNATGTVASGLSTGNYTTVITDAHGCVDSLRFYIGNLSTVSLHIVTVTAVECYNTCNGSVVLNVQNAVLPVTYSLTGFPTSTNNVVSNLCAGFYIVKAVDAIGCPAFDTINFPHLPVFSYSATTPPAICIGKQAVLQATASGGNGGHTFIWNPGSIYGASVSVNPVTTTVYSLNVYDSKNCTLAPYQVTVNVNPAISISIKSSDSGICPGTTAQITPTVSGGDGTYTYTWLPGNSKGSSIFVENITIPTYSLFVGDACGSPIVMKEINIKLHPFIQPTYIGQGDSGCVPLCTKFINTTPQSKNPIWNYGDQPYEKTGDTTTYCYQKAGSYNLRLTVTDSNSCKTSFTYSSAMNVLVRPGAGFITDPGTITLNDADDVLIKNVSTDGSSFKWYIDGKFLGVAENIHYMFSDTGCHDIKLIAENENHCMDSTIRSICVFEGFNFYMPSAFTPNNDGLNDVLLPKGTGWLNENYLFEVYNRWGHKIFSTSDVHKGWDGGAIIDPYILNVTKTDPNDVYSWRVLVTDNMQQDHVLRGCATLVR